ncbi:fimbria/pilus periplasmic chaperone [Citrobacter sp. Cb003]|uniref:fimbrial biogenesis chaperone n=1 Tax=Citrobacter sp. Cb003 TaxID=2985005 RepID=UPI00257F5E2F|nr:fimbria/pilus periplasmic chaperone [Citrobacter sp. Cb003]MDM3379289.1 fimbria/pilus periplasmic chaperone [Citrobacter sp. Cb003]
MKQGVVASIVGSLLATVMFPAQGAIALDRTRAIFPGSEKSISLSISNENGMKPYLAQAWMENERGEKINSPFSIAPPLQRVEAGGKSTIRINALPETASLPQDRESVFWFNLREIPPKSDRSNVMQLALQTRIKLFYRPASIIPERYARWDNQLILHKVSGGYRVENPTPYYMTVISIAGSEKQQPSKEFKSVMIAPKSSATVRSSVFNAPFVTTINDFGGKPVLAYRCAGDTCRAADK